MDIRPHLAAAIAARDSADALAQTESIASFASLVEYRLDLMSSFDLALLARESALPAIFTCRPPHQGGLFKGSADERKAILAQAIEFGVDFIDVEEDILADIASLPRGKTRLIASHHDFQSMPGDWVGIGNRLRDQGADIVKLVGFAANAEDVLPPIAWLAGLDTPGIGIAMGAGGVATRLLAARMPQAFLSFGSASGDGTAPGQVSVEELHRLYGFHAAAQAARCFAALTPWPVPWQAIESLRVTLHSTFAGDENVWLLPIPTSSFGIGILQALQLARIDGVVRLPGVVPDPDLAESGLDPTASAWRICGTLRSNFADHTAPDALVAFWLNQD
ncbi:MAG: type I 3-dehydroquinate dehydratase [Caldilineales bacterium]|nr:type I 3-dehydroquinate dehydratase [Caldilineales bacterium]